MCVHAWLCMRVSVVKQQGVGISEPQRVKQPQPQDPVLFGRGVECEGGKEFLGERGWGNNKVPPPLPPTPCWLFVWTNRLSRSKHCGWNTDVRSSSLCATFPKRVNWLRQRSVGLRTHSHPSPVPPSVGRRRRGWARTRRQVSSESQIKKLQRYGGGFRRHPPAALGGCLNWVFRN